MKATQVNSSTQHNVVCLKTKPQVRGFYNSQRVENALDEIEAAVQQHGWQTIGSSVCRAVRKCCQLERAGRGQEVLGYVQWLHEQAQERDNTRPVWAGWTYDTETLSYVAEADAIVRHILN